MATFSKERAHERAERYAARGYHDRAAREYQSIVDHDPKDVRAWLMLADCLARAGDKAGAVSRYLQVAEYYVGQHEPQKALAVYRQVLNLDPARFDIEIKAAAINTDMGRIHDAIAIYEHAAQAQLQLGRVAEAIKIYRTIADLDPSQVSKRLRLAELYSRESMTAEAVGAFRQAGEVLLKAQRFADYIRVAERLLYHDDDDRPTIRILARVYLQLGDARRALMKLNALLQRDQGDAAGLELLGETFMAMGKPDKATSVMIELVRKLSADERSASDEPIRVVSKALQWDPRNSELIRLKASLGGVVDTEERTTRVVEEVIEELDLEDDDLVELDESDLVLEAGENEVDEDEPTPLPVPALAPSDSMTAEVMREVQASSPHVSISNEMREDFDKILFEARVYIKYRLYEHALEHVQTVLEQNPGHIGGLSLRARALHELGRGGESATVHYEVATRVADHDPKLAIEHLEAVLERVPEHADARTMLETLASGGSPVSEEDPLTEDLVLDRLTDEQEPLIDDVYDDESIAVMSSTIAPDEPAFEVVETRFNLDDDEPRSQSVVERLQASMQKDEAEPVSLIDHGKLVELEESGVHSSLESDAEQAEGPMIEDFVDLSDELAEVRFFLDQGLDEDAVTALEDLRAKYPNHPDLAAFERTSHAAPVPAAGESGAKPLLDVEGIASEEDADEAAYLSAIFEDEPSTGVATTPSRPIGVHARAADVAQANPSDHYDLGMAYRDMGLVDEAIREFEAAANDAAWRCRSLTMAATMRLHRGETERAITDLLDAVDTATTEDERCEAGYELANVYEKLGDTSAAIEQLRSISAGYRDRDDRLVALLG